MIARIGERVARASEDHSGSTHHQAAPATGASLSPSRQDPQDLRRLAYYGLNPGTSYDIGTVTIESDGPSLRAGKPEIFLQTPADERMPAFFSRWAMAGLALFAQSVVHGRNRRATFTVVFAKHWGDFWGYPDG
jgi:hypothetical protein